MLHLLTAACAVAGDARPPALANIRRHAVSSIARSASNLSLHVAGVRSFAAASGSARCWRVTARFVTPLANGVADGFEDGLGVR